MYLLFEDIYQDFIETAHLITYIKLTMDDLPLVQKTISIGGL